MASAWLIIGPAANPHGLFGVEVAAPEKRGKPTPGLRPGLPHCFNISQWVFTSGRRGDVSTEARNKETRNIPLCVAGLKPGVSEDTLCSSKDCKYQKTDVSFYHKAFCRQGDFCRQILAVSGLALFRPPYPAADAVRHLERCANDTCHRIPSDVASHVTGSRPMWNHMSLPWRSMGRQRYGDRTHVLDRTCRQ
jgi:hypothetical protein